MGKIGVTWYAGNKGIYSFEIEFSFDGQVWQQVYKGQSRQDTGMESYEFDPMTANYVRIHCHGNSVTGFSAICEVEIDGLKEEGRE